MARLYLNGTAITDAGLARLAEFAWIGGVTDASVRDTKVTKAGVEKLAAALPGCKIEWDGGVIEPAAPAKK